MRIQNNNEEGGGNLPTGSAGGNTSAQDAADIQAEILRRQGKPNIIFAPEVDRSLCNLVVGFSTEMRAWSNQDQYHWEEINTTASSIALDCWPPGETFRTSMILDCGMPSAIGGCVF